MKDEERRRKRTMRQGVRSHRENKREKNEIEVKVEKDSGKQGGEAEKEYVVG